MLVTARKTDAVMGNRQTTMYLVSTALHTTPIGDVWETTVYEGLQRADDKMRYSMWMPFLEGAQAAHQDLLRRVQNELPQEWVMPPEFLAEVRSSAFKRFEIEEHGEH
jgi:hypothetical protein